MTFQQAQALLKARGIEAEKDEELVTVKVTGHAPMTDIEFFAYMRGFEDGIKQKVDER